MYRRKMSALASLTEQKLFQQRYTRDVANNKFTSNQNKTSSLSFLSRMNNMIKQRPIMTGTGIAFFKSVLADYLTQKVVEKKSFNDIDWRRNLCFGVFGFAYTGLACYGVYAKLYPYLFGTVLNNICNTKIKMVMGQISVDQLIHSPLIYMPMFYCVKAVVYKGEISKGLIHSTLNKYFFVNMKDDVLSLWKFWIPANILTFTVIPLHLRVPYLTFISLVWTSYLSYLRGENDDLVLSN